MRAPLVAGLDIGSSKTAVVIAEVAGDAPHRTQVKILGVGQARTGGIRREVVTDIEATTESVRKAVQDLVLLIARTHVVVVAIGRKHGLQLFFHLFLRLAAILHHLLRDEAGHHRVDAVVEGLLHFEDRPEFILGGIHDGERAAHP